MVGTVTVFKLTGKAERTKGLTAFSLELMMAGQELLCYFCYGTGVLAIKS